MPRPLQVDLLTLKVVSESCVTWATSVPIFSLPRPDVCDRHPSDVRCASSLNAPTVGVGHNNLSVA